MAQAPTTAIYVPAQAGFAQAGKSVADQAALLVHQHGEPGHADAIRTAARSATSTAVSADAGLTAALQAMVAKMDLAYAAHA